jgi:FkbM family methyltransferase
MSANVIEKISPRFSPAPEGETEARFKGGFVLRLPPRLPSARRLLADMYEPEVTQLVGSTLLRGMTLVDAGASVGYYTLLGSRLVGHTGRVYSFEPEAEVHRYLELNVERNAVANVVTIRKALAERTSLAVFIPSALEGGFISSRQASKAPAVTIETVSLDSFFEALGWPSVDLIKLDVEGAEGSVLDGMPELSKRNPQLRLIMEFNRITMKRSGRTAAGVSAALTRLGFDSAYVIELGLKPISLGRPLPQSGLVYNVLVTKN